MKKSAWIVMEGKLINAFIHYKCLMKKKKKKKEK